jgi:hypothetical protein
MSTPPSLEDPTKKFTNRWSNVANFSPITLEISSIVNPIAHSTDKSRANNASNSKGPNIQAHPLAPLPP